MQSLVTRQSVDLSGYPDLVVIILGMRVRRWRGLQTLMKIGGGLSSIQRDKPDGLLLHENFLFSLRHVGMRQYWRDLDSLERFTRSEPHAAWWRNFLKDSGGTGFWHESYRMSGGMEAVYVDMPGPVGFGHFAKAQKPIGPFLSARERLGAETREPA